ncbi:MAG: LuxR C-terminal-related transcriptional regulator, partial [Methylococcales bacterium]
FGVKGRAVAVLYYLCQGYSNQEIATKLSLSENTVRKDYVSNLLKLFKVKSRTQLLVEIARLGIVIPKP